MMTHEIIRKLVSERETMTKHIDEGENFEYNRRRIMHYIKNDKRRNTANDNNSIDDCNMSYLSTKSNDDPIRPRLAVSHTICKY
jgi:hypothetical protein